MSENKTNDTMNNNEPTDNMSQNEELNESLSNAPEAEGQESGTDDTYEVIDQLQAQVMEQKDKYLRLVAEFENYKRRISKENLELRQTAGKEVIQSLLTVLDDVDRAAKQLDNTTDVTVLKEGITLVFNKLRNVMQQKGLKAMDAVKEEFNPDLHEAITEITASEDMKGKVIDVVEQGYYLNDKLIRHAKVVVGK